MWVIASAGLAIALGTYIGGWRIIRTMGKGLTDIQPPQGFAAETASTAVILASSHLGFALSTTQVAPAASSAPALGRRLAEVRWGTAGRMVLAWLFTLPAAALVGGVSASVVKHGGNVGTALIALVAAAVAASIVIASRRNPVHANNVNETTRSPSGARRRRMSARPPEAGGVRTMHLDWTALGQVTAVSIGVTVAVVVVFALGVLGLARVETAREKDGGTQAVGLAQAGFCFLACASVVAYGIYLIVPQFH